MSSAASRLTITTDRTTDHYGDRLRITRERKNLTAAQCARAIRVSKTEWERMEAGLREMSLVEGVLAGRFLGITAEWISEGEPRKNPRH